MSFYDFPFNFLLFIIISIILSFSLLIPFITFIGKAIAVFWFSWKITVFINRNLIPNPQLQAKGRAILITGCDCGFGYASAIQLQRRGWHVFATVLSKDSDGAKELRKCGSTIIQMNVTCDDDVIRAHEIVTRECKDREVKLWAIVNNAGVITCGELEWGKLNENFNNIMQVNAIGYVRVTRQFLPLIRESKGRIINISSVAGMFTAPGVISYSMSKHAVTAFTDGLRRELSRCGVKVIEIVPEAYKTTMSTQITMDNLDACWNNTPKHIKLDFGDHYFRSFRAYIDHNRKLSRDRAHEVINAMIHATTATRVEYKYLCCGFISHIIVWAFQWIPIELLNPIVELFTVRDKPNWCM